MIGLDWDATTIAGGFVIGAVAGAVAVRRLTKHLLEYLRAERRREED